ncbi:MAG: hypothetical protein WAW37_13975 [Syntrophobacteraceae bacterium]
MDASELLKAEYDIAESKGINIRNIPCSFMLKTKDVVDTLESLIKKIRSTNPDLEYADKVIKALGKHLAPGGQGKKREDLDFRLIGPLLKHAWTLICDHSVERDIV